MKNRFNISEEEKKRIKGLHNIKEEDFVSRRGYDSDYIEDDINSLIEDQLKAMTGEYASVSDRGEVMRAKFTYITREFDNEVWDGVLNFLRGQGYEILEQISDIFLFDIENQPVRRQLKLSDKFEKYNASDFYLLEDSSSFSITCSEDIRNLKYEDGSSAICYLDGNVIMFYPNTQVNTLRSP